MSELYDESTRAREGQPMFIKITRNMIYIAGFDSRTKFKSVLSWPVKISAKTIDQSMNYKLKRSKLTDALSGDFYRVYSVLSQEPAGKLTRNVLESKTETYCIRMI